MEFSQNSLAINITGMDPYKTTLDCPIVVDDSYWTVLRDGNRKELEIVMSKLLTLSMPAEEEKQEVVHSAERMFPYD